ncbi:hypothetical protein ACFWIJ_28725 [Streptomyces sp. NPDC127079]|uniref:hypothetical protein n=1 Tax=Streptomyces sp. NPDC127079 TaxID=3347132 RepID=UPI00364F1F40
MAGQLRVLGKEKKAPGSGTMWRAAVPAEQRRLITSAVDSTEEQLLQLRGVQTGPTAEAARRLLRGPGHRAGLIENAWKRTAVAAVNGGMPLQEVARWVDRVSSWCLRQGVQSKGMSALRLPSSSGRQLAITAFWNHGSGRFAWSLTMICRLPSLSCATSSRSVK